MDGIHDLGGMHGFGRVEREENEPWFHNDWERRVFGYANIAAFVTQHGDDQLRRAIERIPPAKYLTSSYYELWHEATITLMKEFGVLGDDELEAGRSLRSLPVPFDTANQARAETLWAAYQAGASQSRPDATGFPHRFRTGDRVVTKSVMPYGHTRLPRYARGRPCTIVAEHGAFIVADRNSERRDTSPDMLYTVEFQARDLWGDEAQDGDTLRLDAWDSYLDPLPRGA